MPRTICKLDGIYFVWSSIVDAPVWVGTLQGLREFLRFERDPIDPAALPAVLKRVEQKGTSDLRDKNVEETVGFNRAGPNESCLTLEGLRILLKTGKTPKAKKYQRKLEE